MCTSMPSLLSSLLLLPSHPQVLTEHTSSSVQGDGEGCAEDSTGDPPAVVGVMSAARPVLCKEDGPLRAFICLRSSLADLGIVPLTLCAVAGMLRPSVEHLRRP